MPSDDTRNEYTVTISGIEHTLLLDDADAEAWYGENAKAGTPTNKARTPANKAKD